MIAITHDQYLQKFKEYLAEQGENLGEGFFGRWAWYSQKEKEFKKKLADEGVALLK